MPLFVNVRDFGAVGNGVADDTSAIQDAIDDIKNTGTPPYQVALVFPAGTYAISSPLVFNEYRGLSILGAGALRSRSFLAPGAGWVGTVIKAIDGQPAPSVMMDFPSSTGIYMRGLSIIGQPGGSGEYSRAGTGIRIATPSEGGDSTAEFLVEDVVVHQCDNAVEFGEEGHPHTSSDSTFVRFGARDCTNGVITQHAQAVNYTFISPEFGYVDKCFYMRGGSLYVSQLSTYSAGIVLYIGKFQSGQDTVCGGPNIGWIVIDQGRLDGNSPRTQLYVVDGTADAYSNCLAEFRNVSCTTGMLGTAGPSRCVLRNASYVRLVGCGALANANGALFDAVQTVGTTNAVIDMSGCFLPPELPPAGTQYLYGTLNSCGKYRVRDCVSQNTPWPLITDFGN